MAAGIQNGRRYAKNGHSGDVLASKLGQERGPHCPPSPIRYPLKFGGLIRYPLKFRGVNPLSVKIGPNPLKMWESLGIPAFRAITKSLTIIIRIIIIRAIPFKNVEGGF